MPLPEMKDIVFLVLSLFTIASACVVAFSRKIVYSGFALLGTFGGVAGLYVMLSSDFVATSQVLIYVGGILILILFAIMLTNRVGDVSLSNLSINYKAAVPIIGTFFIYVASLLWDGVWKTVPTPGSESLVRKMGTAFLGEYLLPFEVISILLVLALIGSLVIVRREVK